MNIQSKILFAFLLMPISHAAFSQDPIQPQQNIVILKKTGPKDSKTLSLNETELSLVNDILKKAVLENSIITDSSRSYRRLLNIESYNRQYHAYSMKGQKLVFVNCFCGDPKYFPYWKKELVTVLDGGNCFFNVIINLSTQSHVQLRINGYG
jgi:hypothetical protein